MSQSQLIWPILSRALSHIERYKIIYFLLAVCVVCSVVFAIILGSNSISAKEAQEKKDVESIVTLVQLRAQLNQIQKTLVTRIESLEREGSRAVSRRFRGEASQPFLEVKPSEGFKQVTDLKEEHYIPRGSVFQARLLTSIKTALSATVVVAETMRTFEMDSNRRIPAHSRLIGESVFDPMMKGVIVRFNTLTSPNGEQFDGLDLLALSENAWPELEGIVFDSAGVEMATALSFGFLSGFSSAGQDRESTIAGSVAAPSVKNQVLSGLSVASFQVAEQALDKVRSQAVEYVVVPANTKIYVLFNSKWNLPKGGIR